jgi:hypothetical protein
MVLHDIADEAARDSLGTLLLVAGKAVELERLDGRRVVALIGPCDLAPEAETVE